MKGYKITDVFESSWSQENKEELDIQMFQTAKILETGNIIWDAMQESGLSEGEMAKKLGVNLEYVDELLAGKEDLTIREYARIMAILGKKKDLTFDPKSPS